MKWYLRINVTELNTLEAMKLLEDIKIKNWQDYLVLSGEDGFDVLRGLEEFLGDPSHHNGLYQIRNDNNIRPCLRSVLISDEKAIFNKVIIRWSSDIQASCFYYNDDKELDYIEKFGLKDPILIKR